jgi:hypothetical protein
MQKLIIEINSRNWDFLNSIEKIKKQLENWFLEGLDKNEEYNFKVK